MFNVDSGTYVVSTPTAAASTEYKAGADQPDPAANTTAGTGMTLQVKVETVSGVQKVTGVQILNAGKDYDFGNVICEESCCTNGHLVSVWAFFEKQGVGEDVSDVTTRHGRGYGLRSFLTNLDPGRQKRKGLRNFTL